MQFDQDVQESAHEPESYQEWKARADARLIAMRDRLSSGRAPTAAVRSTARPQERTYDQAAARREVLARMPFSLRATLEMAPDLDLPTRDIIYTVTWAPAVASDMARNERDVAYLSRDTLEAATGLNGPKTMAPGGIVERAGTVGLVRLVARGTPGAVRLPDGTRRGQASSWTLTRPLQEFRHTPARTGTPRKVAFVGPENLDSADLEGMAVWLHPLHPWWSPSAAGMTAWRLMATLVARYGMVDLVINNTDAARLVGRARSLMVLVMARMAQLGLAERQEGGGWLIRLNSRLMDLSTDDLKYDPVRQPRPSLARAKTHDWGWFTDEGRAVRARARNLLGKVRSGELEVAPDSVWGQLAAMARGAFIAAVEYMRDQVEQTQRRTTALLAASRAQAALEPAKAPSGRPRPFSGPPEAYRSPTLAGDTRTTAEKLAAMRQQIRDRQG